MMSPQFVLLLRPAAPAAAPAAAPSLPASPAFKRRLLRRRLQLRRGDRRRLLGGFASVGGAALGALLDVLRRRVRCARVTVQGLPCLALQRFVRD